MGKQKILFFGTALFILVGFAGSVWADSVFIPAFMFQYPEADNEVEYEASRNLILLQCPAHKPKTFYAQVSLPQGAQITSVNVFYRDNSSFANMELNLSRWNMYSEDAQVMGSWQSSGYSPFYKVDKMAPIKYGFVNNGGYVYRVRIEFTQVTNRLVLYGVKIIYNPPAT